MGWGFIRETGLAIAAAITLSTAAASQQKPRLDLTLDASLGGAQTSKHVDLHDVGVPVATTFRLDENGGAGATQLRFRYHGHDLAGTMRLSYRQTEDAIQTSRGVRKLDDVRYQAQLTYLTPAARDGLRGFVRAEMDRLCVPDIYAQLRPFKAGAGCPTRTDHTVTLGLAVGEGPVTVYVGASRVFRSDDRLEPWRRRMSGWRAGLRYEPREGSRVPLALEGSSGRTNGIDGTRRLALHASHKIVGPLALRAGYEHVQGNHSPHTGQNIVDHKPLEPDEEVFSLGLRVRLSLLN